MKRRAFLSGVMVSSTVVLAGCTGGSSPEVSETISNDGGTFDFDVESGDTIRIEVENEEEEEVTFLFLTDPDGEVVLEREVTEETLTHEAEKSGTYTIDVIADGQALIEVYVESE